MDKPDQQPSLPPPEATTRIAERMARLRADARQSNHLRYLLDDEYAPVAAARQPVPWMMIAAGAAVVASLVGLTALFLGSGDKASNAPAQVAGAPTVETPENLLAGAPTPRTPTRTATGTPAATAASGGVPEGAIEEALVLSPPPTPSILLTTPARESLRLVGAFAASRGAGFVHSGIDLEVASGAQFTVVAACDGRVVAVTEQAGFGKFALVDCGDGWRAIYAGMDTIGVKAGEQVDVAESVIGTVRRTLHFELRYKNRPVDPAALIDVQRTAGANLTPTPEPTATPSATPSATPTRVASTPTAGSGPDAGGGETSPGATPTATAVPPTATPVPPTATPAPPTPTPAPPTPTPTRTPRPPTPVPTLGPPIR